MLSTAVTSNVMMKTPCHRHAVHDGKEVLTYRSGPPVAGQDNLNKRGKLYVALNRNKPSSLVIKEYRRQGSSNDTP